VRLQSRSGQLGISLGEAQFGGKPIPGLRALCSVITDHRATPADLRFCRGARGVRFGLKTDSSDTCLLLMVLVELSVGRLRVPAR